MSKNKSISMQKRCEAMREYIQYQLALNCGYVIDVFPKWSVFYLDDEEVFDGSWNYSRGENAVAYSELRKDTLKLNQQNQER